MIKAIIFDNWGIFNNCDEEAYHKLIDDKAGVDHSRGREIFHPSSVRLTKGRITEREYWKEIFKKINKKFDPSFFGLLYSARKKYSVVDRNMLRLAVRLKKKGYLIPMLSNTNESHLKISKEAGIYDHFYPIILSCRVGMRKPNKNIYLHTLKKLKLKTEECIFIDDNKANVETANNLGIYGIVFKNYNQLIRDLKKLGVKL